ncbi:MAG: TlpA family protein disulfide reductase [Prevotella sp.]
MKRIFFSLCASCIACLCSAQNTVTVNFAYDDCDTLFVRVVDKSFRRIERTDTLVLKDHRYTYTKTLDKARVALVRRSNANPNASQLLYLVPGETCNFASPGDVQPGSSAFYTEFEKVSVASTAEESRLRDEVKAKINAGEPADSVRKAYAPLLEKAEKTSKENKLAYIKANPSSDVSAALVYIMNDYEEPLGLLSAEARNGRFSDIITALQADVDKEKARQEAAKYVADGCEAPDFTLKDINGQDLKLSSLRGKYVILDFWGSWCIWCIRGIPEMKKYYDKYKDKMEILGVDCNDTEQKWKAAVEKHQIPWKHVYNPKDSDITTKYAIQGYPTKIVIGPDGKIVKTVVGEDPAFYTFLDELFSK